MALKGLLDLVLSAFSTSSLHSVLPIQLQPHRFLNYSSNSLRWFLLRNLCTCCSFCLECSYFRLLPGFGSHFIQVSTQRPPLDTLSQRVSLPPFFSHFLSLCPPVFLFCFISDTFPPVKYKLHVARDFVSFISVSLTDKSKVQHTVGTQ